MLEFELTTLDGMSEDKKSLYVETDGVYRLNVSGLPAPEDTTGLKSALKKERDRAKAAEAYEKLGKTPDEIQEMLSVQEAAEQKRLQDEGNFEKIMAQHRDKWDAERGELKGAADQAQSALRTYVGENALIAELVKHGATDEGVQLLPMQYMKRLKVSVEGGKPDISVLQSDGETPMAGTSENGIASVADLVAEAVKSYPSLFKSSGVPGGGKPPGAAGGGSKEMTRSQFDALSHHEKAKVATSGFKIIS